MYEALTSISGTIKRKEKKKLSEVREVKQQIGHLTNMQQT